MSNATFPTLASLGWNIVKQPMFLTKTQRSVSGKEYRAAFMQYPLWTFNLSFSLLRKGTLNGTLYTEQEQLVGFFGARQGAFDSFLYDDPTDDTVTDQSFGTGNGVTTVFPLVRSYGAGGSTLTELVQNVNTITNIKVNGVTIVQGSGAGKYLIDSVGNVTFGTVPAAAATITWSGSYYYRCRFREDTLDFNNFMSQLWELKKLSFVGSPVNKV